MYHAVGPDNPEWIWNHLITPIEVFDKQIKILLKKGFCPATLQELYNHMKHNSPISEKAAVLTFDDGYLDNWVYAYPLLKKHGMKGTIFVNPDFIDPTEDYRPNLEDVWSGRCTEEDLVSRGFLSWHEMRKMQESGVMDIQAHTMSHTWYFCSDEVVDFHYPGNNQYPWLFWNVRRDRKSYYLNENQEHFVPYGTPIYQHGRSLGVRRYFEDKELNHYLVDFVREQGVVFFENRDWRNKLFHELELYKSKNGLKGRYETDEEQNDRFRNELIESKKILEEKLKKKVDFLCWAGGAFNEKTLKIAQEAGYLSTTSFYNDKNKKNTFGEDPSGINRTGCVSEFRWRNKFISYTGPDYFIANVKLFYGKKIYLWMIRLYKIKYLMQYFIMRLFKRGEPR